jgi:hypothetical protein
VLTSSGISAYPEDVNYYPIDITKKYRIRFWAKKSSDANGILYADLRQYSAVGTACATNGGRSPYGISGISITTSWVEYSYEFLPSNAQSGVRFVRLDFLLNYNGTAGKMYLQGVRFEEEIPTVLIADGAVTAQKMTVIALSAITANLGTIKAGTMQSYDYVAGSAGFIVDLDTPRIATGNGMLSITPTTFRVGNSSAYLAFDASAGSLVLSLTTFYLSSVASRLKGTLQISDAGDVGSSLTKPLTLSANGSGTGYIGVDGDPDTVQLSNSAVQINGTLSIIGSESNAIATARNNGGAITTNSPTAAAAITHALVFNWYDTQWQIGNIRGNNTDTQGFGITCGNANLRWRVTNGTTYDYNSLILSGGLSVGTNNSVNAAIEIGSGGTATTPYLDFHSSGTGNDYDARILASGGSSAVGQGALTIYAKGRVEFTGAVQVDGTLACSHNIYVSEWVVANYGIFPGCNGVQQTSVALLGTSSGLTADGNLAVKGEFTSNGRINARCGIHTNLINTGSALTQDNLYQMLSGYVPTIGQDYGIAVNGASGGWLIQYIYRTSSTQIILLVFDLGSNNLTGLTCSAGNGTTVFVYGLRMWF